MQLEIDLQWESAISKPQWLLILEAVFYIVLVRVWQNNAIKEKKTFSHLFYCGAYYYYWADNL